MRQHILPHRTGRYTVLDDTLLLQTISIHCFYTTISPWYYHQMKAAAWHYHQMNALLKGTPCHKADLDTTTLQHT